jgi:beta-N-acetylhexosaminidase
MSIFMIDLIGPEISAEEQNILKHPLIGAIILFTRNFIDPLQLKDLLTTIRSIRPDIIIAIDHEGGVIQRLQRHNLRTLPAARVYGEVYDLDPKIGLT